MDSKEILALLDSLDLDEEIINTQLCKIMSRSSFTNKHLEEASRFLKYKFAVNEQESLDCNNETEFDFVAKLFSHAKPENIELVCNITQLVLLLDPKSLMTKSQHLLQQILSEMDIPLKCETIAEITDDPMEDKDMPKLLIHLKLCNSILRAVSDREKQLSMPFLQVPVENIVFTSNDRVLSYFFTSIIPNFISAISGFSILDRLWNCIKDEKELNYLNLKALNCLAEYYLPVGDELNKYSQYNVTTTSDFWHSVLLGLQSDDAAIRKRATYLIKRALESLTGSENDININTEEMAMVWDKKNEKYLKTMWDNFFILLESLEEMQSNIVLPSLKLFESVKHLGHCWLSCAYNIGLRHENALVRLNCIMYRLEIKVESNFEALTLLNALNDFNLYENAFDTKHLTTAIAKALDDKQSFRNILETIPSVKWCPVPLYYLSETLGEVVYSSLLLHVGHRKICTIINDILRIPCNSPVIKKAIFLHICNFIVNSCKGFIWEDYVSIYPQLHIETPITSHVMGPLATHVKKNLYLTDSDKNVFAKAMTASCENIHIGLLYVSGYEQDGIPFFLNIISDKVANITNTCNRPQANKAQCLADVKFLLNLYSMTAGRTEPYMIYINGGVGQHCKIILQYLVILLSNDIVFEPETLMTLFEALKGMTINDGDVRDVVLELYISSVHSFKCEETPLDKRIFAICMLNYLTKSQMMNQYHKKDMLTCEQYMDIISSISNVGPGNGKLRSAFYEISCDTILTYLTEEPEDDDVIKIYVYLEEALDCGGRGCFKYILKIMNKIITKLVDNSRLPFEFLVFLTYIWTQICELKSNKDYISCVDELLKLITMDFLLKSPQHNSIIVQHYQVILDMAMVKRMPLYFMVKYLSSKNVANYDNMVNILCTALLYAIVPKKDQRITENLTVELLSKLQGLIVHDIYVFTQHIQFLSIAMLNKVADVDKLNEISYRMMDEIDEMLKSKPRYYVNNTTHRKLFRSLQNVLFIFLKTRQVDVKKTATWCMKLLKIPHDNSVKICILWYIALYIYSKDVPINNELIQTLTTNGVPLTCQFTILYYVMRHKISARMHYGTETEFVLDFLLSNTMGPVFSIRLIAQYYTMMLFETGTIKKKINIDKYSSMITALNKTLGDLATTKDKSIMNLRKDYFTQTFDIVGDLTAMFIFHSLQRRCENCNENIDTTFALRVFNEIDEFITSDNHDAFYVEWKGTRRWHSFQHYQGLPTTGQAEFKDEANTIQKKYVPWRSMNDAELVKLKRHPKKTNDLIVVASLVDRPPNLGGLARTCEVFGVMTYVIDNICHLQDKQFRSVSVSAEHWLNVEEVRAGTPLKDYLLKKKSEGYAIVAAEQTSNSVRLTQYQFPKKVILLLGHEKDGIPPNLLPLMDDCVEIPQQGVIRSLNVHVTASIFVWEYVRQKNCNSALFKNELN